MLIGVFVLIKYLIENLLDLVRQNMEIGYKEQ